MKELFELFIIFAKIGMFTIGGGYAMIPLIQQEILSHNWLTLEGIIDVIAISEMTPGPFAINAATFIGIRTNGLVGAAFSTLGVICPSLVFMIIIAKYYTRFRDNQIVQAMLSGLRPAVIGLIASAVFIIAKNTLFNLNIKFDSLIGLLSFFKWRSIVIFIAAAVSILKYNIHPAIVVCICSVLGILLFSIL